MKVNLVKIQDVFGAINKAVWIIDGVQTLPAHVIPLLPGDVMDSGHGGEGHLLVRPWLYLTDPADLTADALGLLLNEHGVTLLLGPEPDVGVNATVLLV